ncbi:MAG TPA: TfoX/Sxy family protein [Polyangiales bacterium]|nr:TfoX/Sxy family protein [Polyangiales bacterium]
MPVTDSFREFLVDQLAGLGEVTIKRMFGGLGLYRQGLFFGIVDDDTLFFRVDDQTRGDFTSREMPPFQPVRREPNKRSLNYYQCPADVLDDADELVAWAQRATRAASSPTAAAAKRAPKPAAKKKKAVKRKNAR